ncbi:cytosine methyltransferase [Cyanophage P-RSM3]|uniref:site-specific DNA-methyltransferase (cytosine-N(4)-specific) n=3 Tax=Ronodorvirus ssm4 TaxID=2845939 RepID=M1PWW9_9CAUD|nr:site-specific DNA-methyltransferase [Prochlorococcus phage P-SSM4]AAX46849.1 DNA adenine methylase [Prochlorococcus phage P-SSM4]AGF91337.1 cytosine methyltransferase [Cyanophage P-SS1]AGH26571.1 cytosine methyltransferase [Cyanophage P-RSM3]
MVIGEGNIMRNKILYGDCRDTLKQFDEQARTCVTSPPYYGLRNYGNEENQIGQEKTPEEFIDQLVNVFKEVRNVLTDDGTLWVNLGDSYYNYRPGKGQSYPKQSVSKTNQDLPTQCNKRGNKLDGLKEKDLIGIPWMFAFAMRSDGWYLRQDIIWHKPNPMPESVKDRCTKSHEYIFLLSKNKKYYYDNEAIKEPVKQDWGTRNRTNGKYHNSGSGLSPHSGLTKSYDRKNKRDVWSITNKPYKGSHFAVFPPDLITPCILAGSEKGDIILDPFMGSGTTAMVAKQLGRDYIGCELHEEYGNLIDQRVPVEQVAQETTNPLADLLY